MALSKRLTRCASFVSQDAIVHDVGTDHGLVPLYLIQNKIAKKVYASDINEGPLQQAKTNIGDRFRDTIVLTLADGLSSLEDDVDTVMISGMGGRLISDILSTPLLQVQKLILQPNMGSHIIRETLQTIGFKITNEDVVYEHEQYYEIIVAERGTMNLSEQQIQFGPILLQSKTKEFYDMWKEELSRVEYAMTHVPTFHESYKKMVQKKKAIEEVL